MALMAETGTEARPPLLPADAALFLDFDGTIAAFASRPDGVTVDEQLLSLLERLCVRQGGALALVSGRSLATLDTMLGTHRYAGAGLHGLEWRVASGKTISSANSYETQSRRLSEQGAGLLARGGGTATTGGRAPDR